MQTTEAIETLDFFNEKVDKLRNSRFARRVFEEKTKVNISWEQGGQIEVTREGPDSDLMAAAALTVRFFIQDNEPSSLSNMADLYGELPISDELKEEFHEARAKTNAYLDERDPTISVKMNGYEPTRRDILETFMWGEYAHSNKRDTYKEWENDPVIFSLLENQFVTIMAQLINYLSYIKTVNEQAKADFP